METKPVHLSGASLRRLRRQLPEVADEVVSEIMATVPVYAGPLQGRMGQTIRTAVQVALGGFIDAASRGRLGSGGSDVADAQSLQAVYDAAYQLGRGEARSGRSMDALTSAYRVGARTSWRYLSAAAADGGLAAEEMAHLAELVFNYIDELSDVSVRGHVEELATSGRLRQRRLEELVTQLVAGASEQVLADAAELAQWQPPRSLTAVILPDVEARRVLSGLDGRTLQPGGETAGLDRDHTLLLVPDSQRTIDRALRGTTAVIGPARPWTSVRASYERALQAHRLGLTGHTETQLVELVLGADQGALADLRARVLAPLDGLTPTSREKLTETLRAWLLHHGRRDDIAAALFVHPQTVRYRMGQLRELFGDRLDDPRSVLELTVALGGIDGCGGTRP